MCAVRQQREFVPLKEMKTYTIDDDDVFFSSDEVKDEAKRKVVEKLKSPDLKIPMLPHVAVRVMQISHDPNTGMREIGEVLKGDQQLAGKLINVANSPVYAGLSKITSIQRAVVQVGIKTVRDMLVAVSMKGTVFRNKQFGEAMAGSWRHSLAVAYISQQIARTIGLDNEYAFLCGLMHDVGKPLLIDTLVDLTRQHKDKIFLEESLVEEILFMYHQAVGGMISQKWGFPALLHDAIMFHHRYEEAPNSVQMANLTHVADRFHYQLGVGVEPQPIVIAEEKATYDLGLAPDQIVALEAALTEKLPDFLAGFAA